MGNIILDEKGIAIEQFKFSKTYIGLLVGSPNKEINNKIISDYQYSLNKGNRKSVFHLTETDYVSKDVLKPVIYSVWLDADPVNDPENQFDGSWLVVSWLGEESMEKPIKQIIKEGLSDFNYKKSAENYSF